MEGMRDRGATGWGIAHVGLPIDLASHKGTKAQRLVQISQ